ncbi:MAG: hypothetical protein PWP23_410 [Candidatus Sumerlaeota bacterium]|nr:hypothetical protein [Candidatus Sumerlaeota bacterium]
MHPNNPRPAYKRILSVFGTRPEAIKMAPVVQELSRHPGFDARVCVTAQHRQMMDQVLDIFEIRPDFDLDLMRANQTLGGLTSRVIEAMGGVLDEWKPDIVLVQGDTTTVMAATLAAFYAGVAVGHVEAGLRTGDLYAPWPEEMNRRVTAVMARHHFAPTQRARQALLAEGYSPESIVVTGNTVIDALLQVAERVRTAPLATTMAERFAFLNPGKRLILVTGHRRESFDGGIEEMCEALKQLAERDDVEIAYPVHLNPNVKDPVNRVLGSCANVHLIAPQDYLSFVWLMDRAHLIVTDSGGVQEEAPSLGKPVLVTRTTTERPEAVDAGTVRLVGTDKEAIVRSATELLDNPAVFEASRRSHNPYGDGMAARRIVALLAGEPFDAFDPAAE